MSFWMCDLQTSYDLQLQLLKLFSFFLKLNKINTFPTGDQCMLKSEITNNHKPHKQTTTKIINQLKAQEKSSEVWWQNMRREIRPKAELQLIQNLVCFL